MNQIDIVKLTLIMLLLDSMWISYSAKNFINMVNTLQKQKFKVDIKSIFFAYVFIVGLYVYAIGDEYNLKKSFMVGLCTYGIYHMTNKAIFRPYDNIVALKDVIWGGILYSSTNYIINKVF